MPQRESDAGALTKYFGKVACDDGFKIKGIEARQRSTPEFVEATQRVCIERFAETQDPHAVVDVVESAISKLHAGTVDPSRLVERNRISKPLDKYTQYTQNVAALERASDRDLSIHPGQCIEYVVVDDEKSSQERVALAHENPDAYDATYYETQVVRATVSVLSPLGWDRERIHQKLGDTRPATLTAFGDSDAAGQN